LEIVASFSRPDPLGGEELGDDDVGASGRHRRRKGDSETPAMGARYERDARGDRGKGTTCDGSYRGRATPCNAVV
jgi:hypothetical protein